jgi:hypothetical protein
VSPNPTAQLTAMLSVRGIYDAAALLATDMDIRLAAAAHTAARRGQIQAYGLSVKRRPGCVFRPGVMR